MAKKEHRVKQHVISMRISEEERNSLNQAMSALHCRRISDLMREAIKLVLDSSSSFRAGVEGADRVA